MLSNSSRTGTHSYFWAPGPSTKPVNSITGPPPGRTQYSYSLPHVLYNANAHKTPVVGRAIEQAIANGFRAVHIAAPSNHMPWEEIHQHEKAVGEAIEQGMRRANLQRDMIFIQKIIYPDKHHPFSYHPEVSIKKTFTRLRLKDLSHVCRARPRPGDMEYLDSVLLHIPPSIPLDAVITTYTILATEVPKRLKFIGLDLSNFGDDGALRMAKDVWDASEAHVAVDGGRGIARPSIIMGQFGSRSGWDIKLRQFCKEREVVYIPAGRLEGDITMKVETMVSDNPQIFNHISIGEGIYAMLIGIGAVLLDNCRGVNEMRGVIRIQNFLGWAMDRQAVRWGEIIHWFETLLQEEVWKRGERDVSTVPDTSPLLLSQPLIPFTTPTYPPWQGQQNDAAYDHEHEYGVTELVEPDSYSQLGGQQQFTAPAYLDHLSDPQIYEISQVHHDTVWQPDQGTNTKQFKDTNIQQSTDTLKNPQDADINERQDKVSPELEGIFKPKKTVELLSNGVSMKTDKARGMAFFEYPDHNREKGEVGLDCIETPPALTITPPSSLFGGEGGDVEVQFYTPVGGRVGAKVYEDVICYDAWYGALPRSWSELDLGERAKYWDPGFLKGAREEFEKKRKKQEGILRWREKRQRNDRYWKKREMERVAKAEEKRLRLQKEEEERLKRNQKQDQKMDRKKSQKRKSREKQQQEEIEQVKEMKPVKKEGAVKGQERAKEESPAKKLKLLSRWSDEMENEDEIVKTKMASSPSRVEIKSPNAKNEASKAKGQGQWGHSRMPKQVIDEAPKQIVDGIPKQAVESQKASNLSRRAQARQRASPGGMIKSKDTRQDRGGILPDNRNTSGDGQAISHGHPVSRATTSSTASSLQSWVRTHANRFARTPKHEPRAKSSSRWDTSSLSTKSMTPRQATSDAGEAKGGLCVIQFPDDTAGSSLKTSARQMRTSSGGYRKNDAKNTLNAAQHQEKISVEDENNTSDDRDTKSVSEPNSGEPGKNRAMEEELSRMLKHGRTSFLETIGKANGVYQAVKNSLARRKVAKERGSLATQIWSPNQNPG
ncbi:hypothetical protein TWF694_003575 [Orbilia ellipsospora]|uniref:Uncharacterized protein n=1 Tax=Orbilia ellipsospora TaxID=2528407 RepID=A0AAV9X0U1_9PEZI